MARDRYPDEVEIKDHNFSTQMRETVANELIENWGTSLIKLAEETGTASRGTYQDVRDEYLGPKSHPITFEEIRAHPAFPTIGDWIDARRRGELGEDGLPAEGAGGSGYEQGYSDGYDDGEQDGFMKGFMKADNLLMEALEKDHYMEVRQKMLETGQMDSLRRNE